jgi:hypothetical protein
VKDAVHLRVSAPITASPLVADIDDDGVPELVVIADRLYCWRLPGPTPLPGYPKRIAAPSASTPVLVRRAGMGPLLLFGSDDDRLYAVDARGEHLPGFPIVTGGDVFTTPLVADLNQREHPAVIFGSDDGGLYVVPLASSENTGPRPITRFATGGFVSSTPALLPRPEGGHDLVFGSWDGGLYCLDGDDPRRSRWRVDTGHLIWSSPVVCDLDGDGNPEVVVLNDRLHVRTMAGEPLPPFPLPLGGMGIATAAVGDLSGEGEPAILAAADRLYAFRRDGSRFPGFPVDTGAPFWASPILADVDGDGRDEIVACDYAGFLHAITPHGESLAGFPRRLGACIVSSPIAADLDGDGLLELIVCSFDGRVSIVPTASRSSGWPTFRGPLGNGIQPMSGRPQNVLPRRRGEGAGGTAPPGMRPAVHPRSWQTRRRKFAGQVLYELDLEVGGGENLQRGLLHFRRHGHWHPSPILRNGARLTARFPPFPRWTKVRWYVTLDQRDGGSVRLPERGVHSFRTW